MTIPNWSMLPGLINIIASVQNIRLRRFLRCQSRRKVRNRFEPYMILDKVPLVGRSRYCFLLESVLSHTKDRTPAPPSLDLLH